MQYETRITRLTVAPAGDPTSSEMCTTVTIDDDAAGEFVVVDQLVSNAPGKISIGPDEWPEIRAAIDRMVKECRGDGDKPRAESVDVAIPGGYTPWSGGECPVPWDAIVKVIFDDGREGECSSAHLNWQNTNPMGNITAYKVVKEGNIHLLAAIAKSTGATNNDGNGRDR